MSSGERSCANYGKCPYKKDPNINPIYIECNVDCNSYRWDEYTEPDSIQGSIKLLDILNNMEM